VSEGEYFAQFAAWDRWTDRAEDVVNQLLTEAYIYAFAFDVDEDSTIELHFHDWRSRNEAQHYFANRPHQFALVGHDTLDIDDYVLWVDATIPQRYARRADGESGVL
jgi:hypothetical protein